MFTQQTNKKSPATAETHSPNHSDAEPKSAPQPNELWQSLALEPAQSEIASTSAASAPGGPAKNVEGTDGARFHTGPNAAAAAESLDAAAFTVGRDVFFGRNQFAPGTSSGDQIIRHELAHVAQANNSTISPHQSLNVAEPYHAAEAEAERIGAVGGHAAMRVSSPTVFRVKPTATTVARHDKDHIFGNPAAVPPLAGLNLRDFEKYTEQEQADWFVHPTLLPADRAFLWEMLLLLGEGSYIRLAIGDVMLSELKAIPAADWPGLKAFCRGMGRDQHTVQIFPPLPPLADRIALGKTLFDLEQIIPPAVLEITVSHSQLQRLQASPALMTLLAEYWANFEPFLEASFSPAPGGLGPEFERVLAFLTALGGPGLAPLLPLKGGSPADRWVRNLHRFPLPMLNQLVANLGDISGKHPLVLILHTGHDAPAAFQDAAKLFSDLVQNVGVSSGMWGLWDMTNLVLMIEGQTSIADMALRIPTIASTWGHKDSGGVRRINQTVIAGHGSGHSVALAGAGLPAPGSTHYPEESLNPVANKKPTEDLLDALGKHMDPATARILYAGCLVGSRTVAAGTPAAAIPAAVAADQSLAQFTETRLAGAGIPITPGVTVQAARGSVGLAALTSLYDPATGQLKPNYPSDPNVFGAPGAYAGTGLEPEGVLRAAVEIAATISPGMAELTLRSRMMMPARPLHWYDIITRMLVPLVLPAPALPPTGVNIELVNEMANVAQVPFLVKWPKFNVTAHTFVTRLNPKAFAADVYTGLIGTALYTGVAGPDEKRLRLMVDQGNFRRTLAPADLLAGILATGLNATQLQVHLNVTPAVLGGHEATLMPLAPAPPVEQIRLALAWFGRDNTNAHVQAFLKSLVVVAAGAPPAFNAAVSAEVTAAGKDETDILTSLGFKMVATGAAIGGGPPPPLANVRVPGSVKNTEFVDAEHPYVATVTVPIANVRPSASTARPPIGTVKLGATVTVAGFAGDWAAIDFNGKLGFINRKLITP
ncbi:MAG TPA: DUF4157 domain-containing protein [Pyrinomonadaceae bacterium]|nr:DUF4157 domain-containing protein [Pyrinomonadaceae bacterium]